jgi:hypothetical protein
MVYSAFIGFPIMLVESLRMFSCIRVDGVEYLKLDTLHECSASQVVATYPWAVLGFLMSLSLPCAIVPTIYSLRSRRRKDKVRARARFLWGSYSPQAHFWEPVRLLRQAVYACIMVWTSDPLKQLMVVQILLYAYLLCCAVLQPWALTEVNAIDIFSQSALVLCISIGQAYFSRGFLVANEDASQAIATLVVLALLAHVQGMCRACMRAKADRLVARRTLVELPQYANPVAPIAV